MRNSNCSITLSLKSSPVSPIFTGYVDKIMSDTDITAPVSIDIFEMAHRTISKATALLVLGPVSIFSLLLECVCLIDIEGSCHKQKLTSYRESCTWDGGYDRDVSEHVFLGEDLSFHLENHNCVSIFMNLP